MKKGNTNKILILIRRLLYIMLGVFDKAVDRKNKVVILCYHSIDEDDWRFSVNRGEFKKQLEFMLKHREYISPVTLISLIKNGLEPERPVFMLTFDDGYGNLAIIKKIPEEYGIQPVLFAVADREKIKRDSIKTDKALLTDSQLKEFADAGWFIGSHGMTHSKLKNADEHMLSKEIRDSKSILEDVTGGSVDYFSYPHGEYSRHALEFVKRSGYQAAFSMDDENINSRTSLFAIPRTGVDGTHSFTEFKFIASPSVAALRKFLKRYSGVKFE